MLDTSKILRVRSASRRVAQVQLLELLPLHFHREFQHRFNGPSRLLLLLKRTRIARQESMADVHMPPFIRLNVFPVEFRRLFLACTLAELYELFVLLQGQSLSSE